MRRSRLTSISTLLGRGVFVAALCHGLIQTTVAQPAAASGPGAGPPAGWRTQATAGYVWQDDAGIDGGGSFGASAFAAEVGAVRFLESGNRLGLAASFVRWQYDFSAGSAARWGNVTNVSFAAPVQWALGGDWRLLASPSLSANYESGASLGDGVTAGGIFGALFQANSKLSIGPGFGVFGKLEDDASVFPIVLVKWRFADAWSLESGRSIGGTQRPGVFVNYEPDAGWRLQAGARFESMDFRLADDHAALPGGAAEDKSIGLFAASRLDLSSNASVTWGIGYKLRGELTLWNESGVETQNADYDGTFNAGASFEFRW